MMLTNCLCRKLRVLNRLFRQQTDLSVSRQPGLYLRQSRQPDEQAVERSGSFYEATPRETNRLRGAVIGLDSNSMQVMR